ncbi:MAG: phenylalanine--tRNA ligase subunit beta [Gaiella sp.]
MKAPLSWLSDYVTPPASAVEIGRRLSVSTAEVERVTRVGVPDIDGNLGHFVVGRVLSAEKHANADKLQLCQVDVGNPDPQQIVCGAWNFAAGATVAVGLPGALLPGFPAPLDERKLRGEWSRGMILAEDEIALGGDHGGIMVLPDGIEPGTPLANVLPLVDDVLDVTITPNRGDLLSMVGLAREIAALYDVELRLPDPEDPQITRPELVEVAIDDLHGCPRYIARLFRGVRVGPSPQWLRSRLFLGGMRPISNVVDVTNYVMHVWGSPLHAFDRAKLGAGIVVRRAHEGEELRTLDGTLRRLETSDLMITDGERSVALAAIMGGLESEVGEETVDVLLEAANFEPLGIMRTSERLGLRSEASNRWEKGVDPHVTHEAAALASRLLVDLAGGTMVGATDRHGELPRSPVVGYRPDRSDRIVGLAVEPDDQRAILTRLGFEVDDEWQVTVPSWRVRDVPREIDLVEEVARVVLDRVPRTMPTRTFVAGHLSRAQRLRRLVEDVLVGAGLTEAYTWSLVASDEDSGALRLPDPLTPEQAVLRTTVWRGLVESAAHNVAAGRHDVRLFEIARVYLPTGEQLPEERWRVSGLVSGGFDAARAVVDVLYGALRSPMDVARTEHPALHPGKAARTSAGWFGELHPSHLEGSWGVFELDLATLTEALPERTLYEDVITFPAVRQDIAVAVPENVEAAALVTVALAAGAEDLREAVVFDVYRGDQLGEGRKSVALRLAFQAADRTLSDEEVAPQREAVVQALRDTFDAELRG